MKLFLRLIPFRSAYQVFACQICTVLSFPPLAI